MIMNIIKTLYIICLSLVVKISTEISAIDVIWSQGEKIGKNFQCAEPGILQGFLQGILQSKPLVCLTIEYQHTFNLQTYKLEDLINNYNHI
jgi:hypothetical protein